MRIFLCDDDLGRFLIVAEPNPRLTRAGARKKVSVRIDSQSRRLPYQGRRLCCFTAAENENAGEGSGTILGGTGYDKNRERCLSEVPWVTRGFIGK
jgi:hypothetical protein